MMTDTSVAAVALAAAAGLLIGLLYFGVLWWTVRRMLTARYPAVLVAGSFLVRAALAAAAIVFVAGGRLLPLLATIAGFLAGRTVLIRVVGAPLRAGAGPGVELDAGRTARRG